jgi:hypothetical protein
MKVVVTGAYLRGPKEAAGRAGGEKSGKSS